MQAAHLFDANKMAWTAHPSFSEIRVKVLETRETHPAASVMLVQVDVGGVIKTHVHEKETETAYVLAGRGTLTLGNDETVLEAGTGVTIPPGLSHSLHNTGDTPMDLIAVHIPPVR
jgi:mannose-6-phosphate isomerase-like protein (cupin superfamily)